MAQVESVLTRRALASGLVEAEALARCQAELGGDAGDVQVVEWLVKQGLLTRWQAAQLEAGRTQNLVLAHYKLLSPLGAGGMGSVYRALDTKLARQVALKVLPPRQATSEAISRFRREAFVALQMRHDNVVTSFELAQQGTIHFLVMELVDGHSLSAYLAKQGRLGVRETARIGRDVALALQHAHEQGIIHRDIKPSNILLSREGHVKVADMGLAKFFGPQARDGGPETSTGQFLGTIDYCSPEQAIDAKRADIRSDIYSLGCTLYRCLAGGPPFAEGTEVQRIMAHIELLPSSIRVKNRDVPPAFAEMIEKRMLAKDPGDRFQTPAEAAEALQPWIKGEGASANLWAGLESLEGLLEVAAQAPRVDVPRAAAQSHRDTARGLKSRVTRRAVKLRRGAKDESILRGPLVWAGLALLILAGVTAGSLWWPRRKAEETIDPPELVLEGRLIPNTKNDKPDLPTTVPEDPKTEDSGDGWTLLFDGKSLDGWTGDVGSMTVEDGVLVNDGKRGVVVAPGDYQNVEIEVEFRLANGGNSGLGICCMSTADPAQNGLEIQMLDDDGTPGIQDNQRCGSIHGLAAAEPGHFKRWPQWNRLRVHSSGDEVRVELNGTLVTNTTRSAMRKVNPQHAGLPRSSGRVCLFPNKNRSEYRSLRARRLPAGAVPVEMVTSSGSNRETSPPNLPPPAPAKDLPQPKANETKVPAPQWDDNRDAGEDTKFAGGTGGASRRTARPRELLRGIECSFGNHNGDHLADIAPVFGDQRPKILPQGEVAREGYAVGGMHVDAGAWVNAVQLIYMRIKPDGTLDAHDFRLGDWIGFRGKGKPVTLTGNGTPIIGLHVREGIVLDAIALVVAQNARVVQRHSWPGVHIYHTAFSPDGQYCLGGGDDGALRVWDMATGEQKLELRMPIGVFTANSKSIVTHNYGDTIAIFDAVSGDHKATWRTSAPISNLAVAPDGKHLVSSHADSVLRLWNIAAITGKAIREFRGHSRPPDAVFSSDSKRLLSAGEDRTVRLWNVETGKLIHAFPKFAEVMPLKRTNLIVRAWFLSDREIAAYVWGQQKRLLVWDAATGEVLRKLDLGADFSKDAAISPDGRYVVTAHSDNSVRLHRLKDGTQISRLSMPVLPRAVSFSPDGSHLIAGGYRGWSYVWRLDESLFGIAVADRGR